MAKIMPDGGPFSSPRVGDKIEAHVVEIFAAVCNSDSVEGKGTKIDKSYHLTKADAIIGASGIGVMGADGTVESRLALRLELGNYALMPKLIEIRKGMEDVRAKLRASAEKKLSAAEKVALDLPDEIDK